MPEDLKKPELTAQWEMQLSDIAKGKKKRGEYMRQIRSYTEEIMEEIRRDGGTFQ